ncbi:MAG TPA: class I SAM-dependent methyltransferase [Bryobacteraceae bacterium]|nr:class I SAM-dependent methyltransferase [Bryobacteraceae bacterium]HPT25802.1 class I SAM-dependent methyltransferase [Bryobacteraceae bacterium]
MKTAALLLCTLATLFFAQPVQAQDDYPYRNGLSVPFVPTPMSVVRGMLETAKVTKTDLVIDLGCGDGRIVVMAASDFGARGIGYDLDPERIGEANANAEKAKVTDRVKFIEKDLFQAEIKDATVVTLYLLPSVNEKLMPRLMGELKPGTRIVSHSFRMGQWAPDVTKEVDGRTIYLWTVKAKPPE